MQDKLELLLTNPGMYSQKGSTKNFMENFMDEFLSMQWLVNQFAARVITEDYRQHHHEIRAYSFLSNSM
jgi:hypothetical protein